MTSSRHDRFKLFAGILLAFVSLNARAVTVVPTSMGFQGYLSGVANGSYNMQFKLKQNGSVVQAAVLTAVAVSSGVFSVVIPGVSPSNFLASSGTSFTMDIEVDTDVVNVGYEESFVGVPITAVPSALVADTALTSQSGNATQIQGRVVSPTAPTGGQVLAYNGTSSQWEPSSAGGGGGVSSITAGTGLTGGTITTSGAIAVDVGTTAGKIVQLDASARLPAVNGSLVTGVVPGASSVGTAEISDGTIQNADISSTAAIAVSKLAGGTTGQIITMSGPSPVWSNLSVMPSQISGTIPLAQGGTGSTTGSMNATTPLSFQSTGMITLQPTGNLQLLPSGGNVSVGTGNLILNTGSKVGLGTSAPLADMDIWGTLRVGGGTQPVIKSIEKYDPSVSFPGLVAATSGGFVAVSLPAGTLPTATSASVICNPSSGVNSALLTSCKISGTDSVDVTYFNTSTSGISVNPQIVYMTIINYQ